MKKSQNKTLYKKDLTVATMMAGDALRAEHLKNARWMFKSAADNKIKIN